MKKLQILFVLPLLFSQCIKQDTPLSKTDLLTLVPYKIVSEKINGQPVQVKECEKDNLLSFDKNGVVNIIDGANRCTGDVIGNWILRDKETVLRFNLFNTIYDYKIIKLDANFLILLDDTNTIETTYTNKF
jgi:hypothetical protein